MYVYISHFPYYVFLIVSSYNRSDCRICSIILVLYMLQILWSQFVQTVKVISYLTLECLYIFSLTLILHVMEAAAEEAEKQRKAAAEEAEKQRRVAAEEAEKQRKAAAEEAEKQWRVAAEETEKQRKIAEFSEDIADLKSFLNTSCGLTKAVSGRCAEVLVVDHDLGTAAKMKRKVRSELVIILSSIGLSTEDASMVLEVTHPAAQSPLQGNLYLNTCSEDLTF
jgi:hypothetical protein